LTICSIRANNHSVNETTIELPVRFGSYYLYDLIGKGGMAEIFLAKTFTELGTERLCVIKRILPELNEDKNFCEMLINEAKLCAQLSHANVVHTYELGQIDGQYYIAMEYVEGVDLNKLLGLLSRNRIALSLQFALYVIIETLRGLDYAHRLTDINDKQLGIIHRDVSPTNVLISTEGEIKLCDFGIAKVALDDVGAEHHLDEYHLKGKVAYMAPEHVAGKVIDRRADLFAVGILLWELLSGRRLYKTKDEAETLRRATEAEIPELADRGFPEYEMLAAIVKKALSKDPDLRFQNGQEFIRSIEDYLHVSGQIISQLRFADFLMENFGEALLQQRRERERYLAALMERMQEDEDSLLPKDTIEVSHPKLERDAITQSLLLESDSDDDEENEADYLSDEPDDLAAKFAREEQEEKPEPKKEKSETQKVKRTVGSSDKKKENRKKKEKSSAGLWVAAAIIISAAVAGTLFYLDYF